MPLSSILSSTYPCGFIIHSYFNIYFMTITLQLAKCSLFLPFMCHACSNIWKDTNPSASHDIFDEWYKVSRKSCLSNGEVGDIFFVCECFNKTSPTSLSISSQFSLSNDMDIKAFLDVAILREYLHYEIGMAWSNAFISLSNLINWKVLKKWCWGLREKRVFFFDSLSSYSLSTALVGMRLPRGFIFEEPGK